MDHTYQYPTPMVAWSSLFVLAITYMISFLDRQILVLLIEPIKADLHLSDTEISLLSGAAFGLVYTVSGLFMGRFADLWVRKYVIMLGVALWSLLTMACGLAQSFLHLFVARTGVGLGEAALTPAAYSMIPDLFPPERLNRVMSIFMVVGVVGGSGAALLLGGLVIGVFQGISAINLPLLGALKIWQLVLLAVGGLSLAMLIPLAFTPEPIRQKSSLSTHGNSLSTSSFSDVLKLLWSNRPIYGPFTIATAFLLLTGYGVGAWLPTYFVRVVGWSASQTGVLMGLIYIPSAIAGGLLAGWSADALRARGIAHGALWVMALGGAASVLALHITIFGPPIFWAKVSGLMLTNFFGMVPVAVYPAILQQITPAEVRGQVSAIFLFIINLVGLACGATIVALVTNQILQDEQAVGRSIAIVASVATFIMLAALLWGRRALAAHMADDLQP